MLNLDKNNLPLIFYSLLGLLLGSYILLACSLSIVWNVLLVAGLFLACVVLVVKDWLRLSIFFVGLSLPIGISKGLIQLENVHVPSLFIQLSDFFVIVALFVWTWRILTKQQALPSWRKPQTLALILISLFAATIFNAPVVALGFFEWITLLKAFLFFLLIADCFTSKSIAKTVIYALLISVLLQLIMATLQQVLQNPLFVQGMKGAEVSFGLHGFETFRPRGTLEHPMQLSSFLLYTQPIIFSLAYFYLKGARKVILFLLFLGSIIIQIWTYSRIGWFSMVCEGLVFLALLTRIGKLTTKNVIVLSLCAIFVLGILGVYHGKISDRLFGYDNMSTRFRRVMEQTSIQLFQKNPLTGAGFGNYAPASTEIWPDNYALVGKEGVKSIAGKNYVHNGYLLILSETGLLGMAIWIGFFGNILLCGYRNIVNSKDDFHLSLSMGVFLSLIGLFVNMGLEHFRNNMLILIIWMCAGMIIALGNWKTAETHKA